MSGSSSGVSSALTRVAVLDDLFVDEAEPNTNMIVTTMATHQLMTACWRSALREVICLCVTSPTTRSSASSK